MTPTLQLPDPVRDRLVELIRLRWSAREDPAPTDLPQSLPEGVVTRLVSGGPFGWLLDARLDRETDGRVALEVLEDSRMAGPEHYRLWEDGTREELPNEHTAMVFEKDATPEQKHEVEQRFYAHNRTVQTLLRERGFRL